MIRRGKLPEIAARREAAVPSVRCTLHALLAAAMLRMPIFIIWQSHRHVG